jgi:DNA-directed RNA polymerase subunit beta'
LEARLPKGAAIISNVSGEVIEIKRADKNQEIVVRIGVKTHETYKIPFGIKIIVKKGDKVEPGSALTDGVFNPHDILKTRGLKTVQEYLMTEILKVYKTQDIEINNKHLEIIVRQMLQKVKVEDPGETNLQLGSVIDAVEFETINMSAIQENKKPARAARILMPITKAALRTDSFLSAASFQETSSILADAAVKGKVDNLIGIKENVIFGKLIPAGTGLKRYRNVGYKVVKQ